MLNVLFGVTYNLETPFFPQLAAPNPAPKTDLYRTCTKTLHEFNPKSLSDPTHVVPEAHSSDRLPLVLTI